MNLYLTRAVLDRDAGMAALAPLLDPADLNRALDAHHRLIWTLFPGKDKVRDFLWRADGSGRFFILSRRAPTQSGVFQPLETTDFAPVLAPGDRLSFILRANATKDRRVLQDKNGRKPNRRVDLVMDALHRARSQNTNVNNPVSARSGLRMEVAGQVANDWLAAKGKSKGFLVEQILVENYSVRRIPRGGRNRITLGLIDLKGILTVTEPGTFVTALARGLGRAKSFGCGLMLIRRA